MPAGTITSAAVRRLRPVPGAVLPVCAAGFFAGIAGALYALVYEIVTYDLVNAVMSANALLMAFIGGVGVFWGPIVGAVLVTLLQSWVSLISNAWQIYVGVLFILMVVYAPGGIAGLILLHRPIWRARRLRRLSSLSPGALRSAGYRRLRARWSTVQPGHHRRAEGKGAPPVRAPA